MPLAAPCEGVTDDVCVASDAPSTNECRTFRCGGASAHFFACCNNCDIEPNPDPCTPRPTFQRTSASPGNYCGSCGAPLASKCGEATSYSCGGAANQNTVAASCNAQIDAAVADTAFCWLFTDCFEAACRNEPFDLPAALRNGTAVCNGAVIGSGVRKRAGGQFEATIKSTLARALNVSEATIAFVRVVASSGTEQVISFAFVETPELGSVTVAQLAKTFKEDQSVQAALEEADIVIAPIATYGEFVVQVERITPTTTTTTTTTKTTTTTTTTTATESQQSTTKSSAAQLMCSALAVIAIIAINV